jgi:hypothetical protein
MERQGSGAIVPVRHASSFFNNADAAGEPAAAVEATQGGDVHRKWSYSMQDVALPEIDALSRVPTADLFAFDPAPVLERVNHVTRAASIFQGDPFVIAVPSQPALCVPSPPEPAAPPSEPKSEPPQRALPAIPAGRPLPPAPALAPSEAAPAGADSTRTWCDGSDGDLPPDGVTRGPSATRASAREDAQPALGTTTAGYAYSQYSEGPPCPHVHRDWARPPLPTSAPGLGSPLPTSAPGFGGPGKAVSGFRAESTV